MLHPFAFRFDPPKSPSPEQTEICTSSPAPLAYPNPLSSRRRLDCVDDINGAFVDPEEKVRRVVEHAIDNAVDRVDLINIGLTKLPPVIAELRHIMNASQDCIRTNTLKLFLASNALEELTEDLFTLRNLSVLSLRSNNLAKLPSDICLLSNLVELSLGGNNLRLCRAHQLCQNLFPLSSAHKCR